MAVESACPVISPLKATTPEHASAALRWFETMRQKDQWDLRLDEQLQLLGGIKKRTFQSWTKKALVGEPVELSRDTMERFSLLLGIYKAFQIIAPADRPEVGRQWFNTANDHPLFVGHSPKSLLIELGTVEALYAVRRYLDAA